MRKLILILVSLCFAVSAFAQQPASQTAPLFDVNAEYVQGIGPGYWPTAGSGLTLNVAAGTCWTGSAFTTYAGGTVTLTASTTNYVYVNTSTCAAAVSATPSAPGIATVLTGASSITSVTDDRTWFSATSFSQLTGTISQTQLAPSPAPNTCLEINGSSILGWASCAPLDLQINGVDNTSQTLLDLIAGTGVSIVDNPSSPGQITISSTSTLPATPTVPASNFLNGYNATTGAFSFTQPSSANLSDFPAQTGNSGKFLTTNGTSLSWGAAGGSANAIVNNPSVTQTITPGSASVEGLVIQSNGGTTTNAFDVNQDGWDSIKVNGFGQVFLSHSPSVDSLQIDSSEVGTVLSFLSAKDHITQPGANSDISGTITITAATTGSYTFARAYTSAPSCVATLQEATAGTIPAAGAYAVSATTAALRVDVTTSGTYTFGYSCHGAPN